MSLFAVAAADIDTAGRSMDADLPVDWLDKQLADADARAMGPGHLSVRLSRVGNEIVVRGKARVSLHAPCGRCLSSAKLSIEADMSLLLKPARAAAPEPASVEARGKPARKGRVAAASSTEAPSTGGKAKRAPKEKDLPEYEFEAEDADVVAYEPVWIGDKVVGFCSSGGYSHWTGKSVAQAFVPVELIKDGLVAEIEILGERRKATMVTGALWDGDGARMSG